MGEADARRRRRARRRAGQPEGSDALRGAAAKQSTAVPAVLGCGGTAGQPARPDTDDDDDENDDDYGGESRIRVLDGSSEAAGDSLLSRVLLWFSIC